MSQQNISVLTLTMIASGTVLENRAIGFDGAQSDSQGQKVMGTAVTSAADGEAMAVVTHGTAIIETGTAVTVGDSIITDAQGRAIPVTSVLGLASGAVAVTSSAAHGAILEGADFPEFVFADALQAASGAGESIEVLLRR